MQIPVPLEQTFDDVPYGDSVFSVTFRQATGADDDALVAYDRQVRRGHWVEEENGKRYFEEEVWEPEKLAAEKVRLVLIACELEDDGKLLFEKGMNRKKFEVSWGKIPSQVRNALYKKCLEVNPDWDPFRMTAGTSSESSQESS